MSDLIEDQKIHYIVKDYRRMYNGYWTLKTIIEEQDKSLKEKDKEILILRSKVNELENSPNEALQFPKECNGLFNEAETTINATIKKLEKRIVALTRASENLAKVKERMKQ